MRTSTVEKITDSATETKEFARKFAKKLKKPTIVTLYGHLGSGKTTFIQGLTQGLGIKKRVLSPTFVFVRSYSLNSNDLNKFHHVDLYRLESEDDVETVGLKEILEDKNSIIAIEWPEKIVHLLPKSTIKIVLKNLGENKRKITLKTPQPIPDA